jgi:hypothetical protein
MYVTMSDASLLDCLGKLEVYWGPRLIQSRIQWVPEEKKNCGPVYHNRYSDSLRGLRTGDRIPVGERFSAIIQTAPGIHPASYTMGTGSFPGV